MKIVFMGTPAFALPSLKALLAAGHQIAGVFTQPDRPAGRGKRLEAPPVKEFALQEGIPVYQFAKIRLPEGVQALKELAPELCVTCAFGQILSEEVLSVPEKGTVNVHASLLPKYRGAAPIQGAIAGGETVTGITTMLTEIGLDTGPILLQKELPILPGETAKELTIRLATLGGEVLVETLAGFAGITPRPQDNAKASHYPTIKKHMARIDWHKQPEEIINHVRAMNDWPMAFCEIGGQMFKVHRAEAAPQYSGKPGTVVAAGAKTGLFVACNNGAVRLVSLQPAGGRAMQDCEFLRAREIPLGSEVT